MDRIVDHARRLEPEVLPQSALGGAIGYLLGNLDHLESFLEDPLVPLDNNLAERALRAIALGRKNYLHFGSLAGGSTAAVLYSLIGSCKTLGINPYAYLLGATEALLQDRETARETLTPWAWAAADARRTTAALEAETAASPA